MDTDIQNTVAASVGNAQYDTYAKSLLARKSILSRILAATVDEFKGMPPDDIAELIEDNIKIGTVPVDPGLSNKEYNNGGDRIVGFNTESAEMAEGTIFYDIVFYVKMHDGLSQIIVNIEAQKNEPSGYDILNRAIYYVSRLISSQKERDFIGQNYDDLMQVWSIWICMNMDECIWNHVHLVNDSILSDHKWAGKPDLFHVVLLGLPKKLPEQDEKYELHRMLSTLLSANMKSDERIDILKNEYKIIPKSDFKKEMDEMCNLSQGVYEQGLEDGEARGRAEGEARGRAEGEAKGEEKMAKKFAAYLKSTGLNAEQISDVVKYSADTVRSWLEFS